MYLVNIPQREKAVLFGTNCMSRLCLASRVDVWYCGDNASVNSSCAHPPPGNCGAFACPASPGGGALANLARPGGRAFAYPRAFDTHVVSVRLKIQTWRILSQMTSSSSQIGSPVKDWTNLWRFSRFYEFLHCLSRHNYRFI